MHTGGMAERLVAPDGKRLNGQPRQEMMLGRWASTLWPPSSSGREVGEKRGENWRKIEGGRENNQNNRQPERRLE